VKRREWADNVFLLLIFLSLPLGIMMALYVGAHPDNFITRLVALAGMDATDGRGKVDTIEILAAGCFFLPVALIMGLYFGVLKPLETYGFRLSMRYIRLFFKSISLVFNPGSSPDADKNSELKEWQEVTDEVERAANAEEFFIPEENRGPCIRLASLARCFLTGLVILALILAYVWWNNGESKGHKKAMIDDWIRESSRKIKFSPRDPNLYISRGQTYSIKGNYGQAIADYTKAKELGYKVDPEFMEELKKKAERKTFNQSWEKQQF
jgi:hypothetical protein